MQQRGLRLMACAVQRGRAAVSTIAPSAVVASSARIGADCWIGPHALIGDDVVLGDGCRIGPGVVLQRARLGQRVIVHSAAAIGDDGFGWIPADAATARPVRKPQSHGVQIGDDVEIGAHCTIARGSWRDTTLEGHVKLDAQVHVGHNVLIGAGTLIAAQTGIAGSATIGRACLIGGQVGIAQRVRLADGVRVAGRSVVIGSLALPGAAYAGAPAVPLWTHLRRLAAERRAARGAAAHRD